MRNTAKVILIIAAACLMGAASTVPTTPSKDARNRQLLNQTRLPWSAVYELSDNMAWSDLQPVGFEYTILFNEGASKGLQLLQNDGTAWDTTAAVHNTVYYGRYRLNEAAVATATGTFTPTANATGLDITGASSGNNDNVAYWAGVLGAPGRPLVVGTDPAAVMCVTTTIADVSGTDSYFIGWRSAEVPVALASYTDFCGFNIISGDINVTDTTTGDTDTTDNWTDTQSKTMCVYVSSAGACTYTNDGSAPTVTDAHTLGDGLLFVPAVQLLNDTDVAEDTIISSWQVAFQ